MAQIDDLKGILDGVSTAVDEVGADVARLIEKLNEANQNPAVDLTDVIAQAQSIKDRLDAVNTEGGEPNQPTE